MSRTPQGDWPAGKLPHSRVELNMPHRVLKVPERGMLDAYEAVLSERGFSADAAQRAAAERLQLLYYQLLSFKVGRKSTMRRVFSCLLYTSRCV